MKHMPVIAVLLAVLQEVHLVAQVLQVQIVLLLVRQAILLVVRVVLQAVLLAVLRAAL